MHSVCRWIALGFVAGLLCLSAPVRAQSVWTEPVGFQGVLKNASGTPVADTISQALTFRVYDAATLGNKLWEQPLTNVTVHGGLFAVSLDFSTGFVGVATNASVFGGAPAYVEVQAGADPPMTPRRQFSAVPYSFTAQTALSVPNGSITALNLAPGVIPAALPPSGPAGGDVAGTYPNPTLASLATSLSKVSGGAMTSSGGNIGIGTATPGFPLSFPSTLGDKIALWGASGMHYGLGIQSSALQVYTANVGSDVVFGYGSSAAFTETMRIKGNGSVGIGTGSPVARLEVVGSALGTAAGNTSVLSDVWGTTSNAVHLRTTMVRNTAGTDWKSSSLVLQRVTDVTPQAFIAMNGSNVGIGTNTPVTALDVNGEVTAKVITITGGADVAEPYHVTAVEGVSPLPGMVVVMDPVHVG